MNYLKDIEKLCMRVNVLEINSEDYNRRLNKLEGDEQVERCAADALGGDQGYALDWYKDRYQDMCKEYNKVKIELDDKQKVLEMYIEQNHKFFDQIDNQKNMIKELEDDYQEQQNMIKLFEAANVDMARKIKDLEHKNKFISDLNNVYRKMILKDG